MEYKRKDHNVFTRLHSTLHEKYTISKLVTDKIIFSQLFK